MFTGLVQAMGSVCEFKPQGNLHRLILEMPRWKAEWGSKPMVGDSMAVNGVCLTILNEVEDFSDHWTAAFDVSNESIERSQFSQLKIGDLVNIEWSLAVGDRLGGHIVSGHVDGVGEITRLAKRSEDDCFDLSVRLEGKSRQQIAPFVANKGSLAIQGVSLTVNAIEESKTVSEITFCILPHTMEQTNFHKLSVGALVNVEADPMVKQFCRYQSFTSGQFMGEKLQ